MDSLKKSEKFLFGFFAWRMGLITKEELSAAITVCSASPDLPIRDALIDANAITESVAVKVEELLTQQLQQHQGDSTASLRSLQVDVDTVSAFNMGQVTPAHADGTTAIPPSYDRNETHVALPGQFDQLKLHAEGGLGRVHRAKDLVFNREVAFKEIRPELAGDQEARFRFLREARITAMLEHPGIVPIYGIGHREDGAPFYATRFVEGPSLEEAISALHSSPHDSDEFRQERRRLLRRFVDVCQAVEYAHSKGVIHRDLKPSNIVLGDFGETFVVDWGLAKQNDASQESKHAPPPNSTLPLHSTLAERDCQDATQLGTVIGTPDYMSPEQAAGNTDALTPQSDVYSLGATLHQLLTGNSLFDESASTKDRIELAKSAAIRISARGVNKTLLAICRKALQAKQNDRYSSCSALAVDIEAYLADEPISARPDSSWDRLSRWSRKHRAWASAGIAALFLVAAVSTISAMIVSRQKTELATREREATQLAQEREAQRAEAEKAGNKAQAALNFLTRALKRPRPANDGSKVTIVEVLAATLDDLSSDDTMDKESVMELQRAIGDSYLGLEDTAAAIDAYSQALDSLHQLAPIDDAVAADIHISMAIAFQREGRPQDEVFAKVDESLTHLRRHVDESTEYDLSQQLLRKIGWDLKELGRHDVALQLHQQMLEITERHLAHDPMAVNKAMGTVAASHRRAGNSNESLAMTKQAVDHALEHFGLEDPQTAKLINNLAVGYYDQGKFDEAIEQLEKSVEILKRTEGENNSRVTIVLQSIARLKFDLGRLDEAEVMVEDITQRIKRSGRDTPTKMDELMLFQGRIANAHEDFEGAEQIFRKVVETRRKIYGAAHPETILGCSALAKSLMKQEKFSEAFSVYAEITDRNSKSESPNTRDTRSIVVSYAVALRTAGKLEEALEKHQQALEMSTEALGSDHPMTLGIVDGVGTVLSDLGRFEDGLEHHQRAHEELAAQLGDENLMTIKTGINVGAALAKLDRSVEAIKWLEKYRSIAIDNLGSDHAYVAKADEQLARIAEPQQKAMMKNGN